MTKVLGIVGSPRKNGNTDILVNRILDGAKGAGADIERVFLADLEVAPCDACNGCLPGKPCKIDDDMNELYGKVLEADTIVYGTPVYWYGPSAQIKAFIDRFQYFFISEQYKELEGKKAVVATVYEESGPDVADAIILMFEKIFTLLKFEFVEKAVVADVLDKGAINKKTEALENATRLGASLA